MINPDDVTGHNTAKYSFEFAKMTGIKVLVSEFYQRGTQDFRPILLKMIDKNPDLIDFGASVDAPVIMKQLLELGYKGKKVLCAAAFPPAIMLKLATPEAMEGAIVGYLDPDSPKASRRYKEIFDKYKAKYNELQGPMGILAYDSLSWLVAAIEKANTLDTTKVRDTMAKLPFETSYGLARWKGKEMYGIDRLAIYPSYWSEVRDGKLVYIGKSEAKLIPMIK
jgi:branched-chain amino acid transport system substrate-binding protein